jgi:cell division protein FtsL
MLRLNTVFLAIILLVSCVAVSAQDQKPLTSQEIVSLLYQLQRNPDTRDELIEQIRKRGIGFALTDGMRSLVAT